MAGQKAIGLFAQPFYYVRHGETESNLNATIAGSLDVALTARGHAQAHAAAAALESAGVTAIYSSALRRSRDTAEHIARALGREVTVIPELAERNWGALEGQPRSIRARFGTPPDAETPDQFMRRIMQALAAIDGGGTPLMVAHSGVFRVLCRVLGVNEPKATVVNAQPLLFLPGPLGGVPWTFEDVPIAPV